MKYMFILISVVGIFLTTCSTEKKSLNNIIPIDLENKKEDISFYDLFKTVDIIFLESTESCLISEVTKTINADSIYYIFDKKQMGVFAFNNSGAFLFKIQKIGRGPGEFINIVDFEINEFTQSIDLLTPFGEVLKYNRESGEFISSYHLPESVRAVHYFKNISRDTIVFYQMFEKNKLLFYSVKEQMIIEEQRELPYFVTRYLPGAFNWHPFQFFNGKLNLFEYFSNTIFVLEDGELHPRISWDFGSYTFDYKSLKADMDRQYYEDYLRNNSLIQVFSTYLENDSLIITQFFFKDSFYSLIFFKENGEYIVFDTFKEGIKFPTYPLFDKSGLFVIAQPWYLENLLPEEIINSQGIGIPEGSNKETNPIILRYTLK
ncbi:MAG: 6-bladed beta-propeller [Bacteroidales bacterium]|nr:6-bladed beta-propeller [Bacteroidales bacterium]